MGVSREQTYLGADVLRSQRAECHILSCGGCRCLGLLCKYRIAVGRVNASAEIELVAFNGSLMFPDLDSRRR